MDRHSLRLLIIRSANIFGARVVYRLVEPTVVYGLSIDEVTVAYSLGIYLLNLFLAFISPKFDPSLEQDEGMEEGASSLPTKQDQEFRPFVRRLPEFKFWYAATRAVVIAFICSWFAVFDLPVFWPVLVVYWLILVALTSTHHIWKHTFFAAY